jgi:two-component system, response regulator PdtaR
MTAPLRIAVAEDERDMREYLQETLKRLGHEVVVMAESGRQLVERCEAAAPDLVITDIKMPDLDGVEASVAVNRRRHVPVILLSAHHDSEILARLGTENMIMAYLVKPINEADLKAAIAVARLRFQHFVMLQKEAADLRQALEDRKIIERAKGVLMRRIKVDEEEAFRRLRMLASEQNLKLVELGRRILTAEEVFARLDKV